MFACDEGYTDVVKLLLDKGANVHASDQVLCRKLSG